MTDLAPAPVVVPEVIRRNRLWVGALGLALLVSGLFVILGPLLGSIRLGGWIAAVFVLGAGAQVVQALATPGTAERLAHLGAGAIYALAGMLLLFNPTAALNLFALLVAAPLLGAGVWQLLAGLRQRPEPGWQAPAAIGAMLILAAVLLGLVFPGTALWLLTALAGVAFMAEGWVLVRLFRAAG